MNQKAKAESIRMNRLSIIILLGLGLALFPERGRGQTNINATKAPTGNYYSLQHPEWPPSPSPIGAGLKATQIEGDNWVVDDRDYIYPVSVEKSQTEKRLKLYNTEMYLRHPEEIRTDLVNTRLKLADRTLSPRARQRTEVTLHDFELLAQMAQTNPPAPYTLKEEMAMKGAVQMAELIRTNRAGVIAGTTSSNATGMTMLKCAPEHLIEYEYWGNLAKAALASTNRKETLDWQAFKPGMLQAQRVQNQAK